MSNYLLYLQWLLVILSIVIILVGEPIYRWLGYRIPVLAKDKRESPHLFKPWFWIQPVETGILEVAFAASAAAIALPAFIPSYANKPRALLWIFQIVIMVSSSLAAVSSLWLFRIYIQQQAMPSETLSKSKEINPESWRFWIRDSGPYSLLAIAMIFLLVGLGCLVLIVTS